MLEKDIRFSIHDKKEGFWPHTRTIVSVGTAPGGQARGQQWSGPLLEGSVSEKPRYSPKWSKHHSGKLDRGAGWTSQAAGIWEFCPPVAKPQILENIEEVWQATQTFCLVTESEWQERMLEGRLETGASAEDGLERGWECKYTCHPCRDQGKRCGLSSPVSMECD